MVIKHETSLNSHSPLPTILRTVGTCNHSSCSQSLSLWWVPSSHSEPHHPAPAHCPLHLPTCFTLKNHVATRHLNKTIIWNTYYLAVPSYFWKDYTNKCICASRVGSGLGQRDTRAALAKLAEILSMFRGGALFAKGIQNHTEASGNHYLARWLLIRLSFYMISGKLFFKIFLKMLLWKK